LERGFDVLTTQQAGLDTASDEQQLAFATAERRAILTFNIRDFAPLHERWLAIGRSHAGIVVSQQLGRREYGTLLARAVRLLETMTAEELSNNLVHLNNSEYRSPPASENHDALLSSNDIAAVLWRHPAKPISESATIVTDDGSGITSPKIAGALDGGRRSIVPCS
jgi:hypothetical protein